MQGATHSRRSLLVHVISALLLFGIFIIWFLRPRNNASRSTDTGARHLYSREQNELEDLQNRVNALENK